MQYLVSLGVTTTSSDMGMFVDSGNAGHEVGGGGGWRGEFESM